MEKKLVFNGNGVYMSKTGLIRVGTKGKATSASNLFGSMPKGQSRKLRKALRLNGYAGLAGAQRVA